MTDRVNINEYIEQIDGRVYHLKRIADALEAQTTILAEIKQRDEEWIATQKQWREEDLARAERRAQENDERELAIFEWNKKRDELEQAWRARDEKRAELTTRAYVEHLANEALKSVEGAE